MSRGIVGLAMVVAGAWLALAGAVQAAPAMWLVSNGQAQVYLFGTLHALGRDARWRTPAYDAAYARADTVWFEADLGGADPQAMAAIMQRYGVDPDHRLSERLEPADLAALERQRVDLARIDHLRPWAAALMLSMQPVLAKGASVERGADMTMTRAVRSDGGGKQLRTFETLEDQARMFASLPRPAEDRYLAEVIHDRAPRGRAGFGPGGSLEQAWLDGDLGRLAPRLVGELKDDNPGLYDALLKRRNLAWADALTAEMAGAHVELVNVGALHMLGADGLPALMRARGFEVRRVQ